MEIHYQVIFYGCLVSILPLESIQSHSTGLYIPYNSRNLPDFLRRRTRVDSTADNADNSQSQAATDGRLLKHVTLAASNAGSKPRANSLALRAEYRIVGIPHNTAIYTVSQKSSNLLTVCNFVKS